MKKYIELLIIAIIISTAGFRITNAETETFVSAETNISADVDLNLSASVKAYGVVGKSFVLDGSRSTDDEIIKTFHWTQVEGPKVSFSTSADGKISFVPKVAGTYIFELIVTDSTGLVSFKQKMEVIVQNNESDLEFLRTQTEAKGNVEYTWKVEEGQKSPSIEPDEIDSAQTGAQVGGVKDDGVILLNGVTVRGWDPEKKETILGVVKTYAQVRSSQDLENFAAGVLLKDDSIEEAEVSTSSLKVVSSEPVKFLGLFSAKMRMKVSASADGKVKVRYPWFAFLYSKLVKASEVETEINSELSSASLPYTPAATIAEADFQATARVFTSVSNVLKTRHDTVKNSVGNIR